MKEWLKQNWFKFGILIVLLIISGSVYYHFNIYIPNKEYEKEFQKNLDESTNKTIKEMEERTQGTLLDICLEDAEIEYQSFVKLNGTENDDNSIWATKSVWDQAAKNKKSEEDSCYKRYPIN